MTKTQIIRILNEHLEPDVVAEIAEDIPSEEDEYEARCEDAAAAAFEDAAHGYDFDEETGHTYDPNTGMSVYDFDPGIKYNDGGEPMGYC